MDLIISHGHCPDGFCAAFIAKKKYPNAEVMFLDHGVKLEDVVGKLIGKDVLMLDFSFRTRDENTELYNSAKSFRILDHHKTARETLDGLKFATFDMKRSGAGLAWDHLFGYEEFNLNSTWSDVAPDVPSPRPWYVDYTEARDLWQWERYPDSHEVCAYLGTLPFDFHAWSHLDSISAKVARVQGEGALAHINHYVREAVKQAQTGVFDGYKTSVLNVPYLNCSEVGNELAKTHEVSLTYFERGDQMIQFSLRSIGDIDVSALAKKYGGGGHKNAAGFQMPVFNGRELVDTILNRNVSKASSNAPGPRHG